MAAQPDNSKGLPVVSIGMPVYNGEKYIREALDSLLTQTFADFDLIISDNASTDGTENICREYAGKDKRIRYIRQELNQGASQNFNHVLNMADGKFFMWAAHDDKWNKDYVELLSKELANDEELAFVYGRSIFIDDLGAVCGKSINNFFRFRFMRNDRRNPGVLNAIVYFLDRSPFKIYGLYKTSAIKNYKFKPFLGFARHADNVLLMQFLSANKAAECPIATHFYRILPRPPEVYAEVPNFVNPTHLDVELTYFREFLKVLWTRMGVFSVLLLPAFPLLFLGALGKPRAIKVKHWMFVTFWTLLRSALKRVGI
jgi:glycosyltransferase involved in cell wall biosynthesis